VSVRRMHFFECAVTRLTLLWVDRGRLRLCGAQCLAEVWWCPGRLLDWMPPYQILSIEQWCVVVIVTVYTLFVKCDVTLWRPNQVYSQHFGEVCWHNLHIEGHRSSGRAGGAVKELRAMETYKKQKIVTSYVSFCSSTMLTSKIIT